MTKTKNYKFGKMTFKSYFKTVGNGFEVGLTFHGKPFFVGNFIHQAEATKWWNMMGTYCKKFFASHTYMPTASETWYCKYFGHFMYKNYYSFLDKEFTKYQKTYTKKTLQFSKHYKKFENLYHAA